MTVPAGGAATGGPELELVLLDDDGRPQLVLSDVTPGQPPPAAGREPSEPTGDSP